MKKTISAFTHKGSVRDNNQDNILVNGQILNQGEIHLTDQHNFHCFVADGVGGNKGGNFASHFVLERIKAGQAQLLINSELFLKSINSQLIEESNNDVNLKGCCTTLSGLIVHDDILKILHAGDSQIWLLRNKMFFKITHDHILNEEYKNSPITSYFGGIEDSLKLDNDISLQETLTNDIFVICSDGLLKSLNQKIIKSILLVDKDLHIKAKKILENCLQTGAEDNISAILIHLTN